MSNTYNKPAELGSLLRELRERAGLTLKQAADGLTSATSLSLLERGMRGVPLGVLEGVASRLGADLGEVFNLAGAVHAEVSSELASHQLRLAMRGGLLKPEARGVLRRVHLSAMTRLAGGDIATTPVDVVRVAYSVGLDLKESSGVGWGAFETAETLICQRDPQTADGRFFVAHGVGHKLLASESGQLPRCRIESGGVLEAEATFVAGHILLPPGEIATQLPAITSPGSVETPSGLAGLVQEVASSFRAPLWMAAERLAQDGWFSWAAGVGSA